MIARQNIGEMNCSALSFEIDHNKHIHTRLTSLLCVIKL